MSLLTKRGADSISADVSNVHKFLFAAAEPNNLPLLRKCLQNVDHVDVQDHEGITALHMASGEGVLENVQFLVDNDAQLDVKDKLGQTPLVHALVDASKNLEVAKFLVKRGANINAKINEKGDTPVHLLFRYGWYGRSEGLELERLFLAYGADIHDKDNHGETPLQIVITHGNIKLAQLLVDYGTQDGSGRTLLHLACGQNSKKEFGLKLAQIILERNWDVNAKDNSGRAPMHYAAAYECLEPAIFDLLLENGAEVDPKDNLGQTPLHLAMTMGNMNNCQFLLIRGAGPMVVDNQGETLLHTLCSGYLNEDEVCLARYSKYLVNRGVMVDSKNCKGETPLAKAIDRRFLHLSECLVRLGANQNTISKNDSRTLLHLACARTNSQGLAKFLLKNGAKVDLQDGWGMTSLHCACNYLGFLEIEHRDLIMRLLRHPGTDINGKTRDFLLTALHLLVERSARDPPNPNLIVPINFILSRGKADVNSQSSNGMTPLHMACLHPNGDLDVWKSMLACSRTNVFIGDYHEGNTPIHLACRYGHMEAVKLLVQSRPATVNIIRKDGSTPLHISCGNSSSELTSFLLSHGAKVNARSNAGWTPLHIACKRETDYAEVAKLLLENGAEVNAGSEDGWTPLHEACKSGRLELVALLLSRGANLVAKSTLDETRPLHVASHNNHIELVWFLVRQYPCVAFAADLDSN